MNQHVMSLRATLGVYVALLLLLLLTIGVAYIDLGQFGGFAVAMTIATIKAVLIILYFMHVKESSKLIWVYSGGAFFWFGLLLLFGLSDYLARNVIEALGK